MVSRKIVCKDTGEIVKGYNEYLKTKHWAHKRKYIAKSRKNICEKCKVFVKKGFHIHHLTYKRIGNEKPSDLVFLCGNCHKNIDFLHSLKSKVNHTLTQKGTIKALFEKHFNNFLKELKEEKYS